MIQVDGFVITPPSLARAAYIRTDIFAQQSVAQMLLVVFGGRWPRMN